MNNNQQSNSSSLKNLFAFSFPGVHLLQISLVRDLSNEDSYKKKHFCFITLVPGEKVDQTVSTSGRTFNWQNRINMKAEADKILSLSYALKTLCEASKYFYNEQNQQSDQGALLALRQHQLMGKTLLNSVSGFTLFADSSRSSYSGGQGNVKSFSLQLAADSKNAARPTIMLWGKEGQGKSLNYAMNPAQAMSIAQVCDFIGNKALELEFELMQSQPQRQQTDNQGFQSQPQQQNVPPLDAPISNNQNTPQNVLDVFGSTMNNMSNNPMEESPF